MILNQFTFATGKSLGSERARDCYAQFPLTSGREFWFWDNAGHGFEMRC